MTEKILIAYYSRTGNTRKIADLIQKKTGGTLFEVVPKTPYPASYRETVDQAKVENRAGFKPELISIPDQLDQFDIIFIGTPNWWSTVAPPIVTFLTSNDFSEKTIIPFCTHGGGGLDRIATDIVKYCPGSTVLESFVIYGNGGTRADSEVTAWLKRLSIS
jgi:flavodoxin